MADYNSNRRNWSYSNDQDGDQYGKRGRYDQQGYSGPYRGRGGSDNIYGGDTRNYGNANQGGYDRNWWDRTVDTVSNWFNSDDADRNQHMDRSRTGGGHRGKGPKGYIRSENRIREDVYDRLADDDRLDASDIEVQVQGDVVILSGTVNSRAEKRRAEDLVDRISGVRNVENRIHITHDPNAAFDDDRRWDR